MTVPTGPFTAGDNYACVLSAIPVNPPPTVMVTSVKRSKGFMRPVPTSNTPASRRVLPVAPVPSSPIPHLASRSRSTLTFHASHLHPPEREVVVELLSGLLVDEPQLYARAGAAPIPVDGA